MDALCRELGDRGRADADVVIAGTNDGTESQAQPESEPVHELHAEVPVGPAAHLTAGGLQDLKVSALKTVAASIGVTGQQLDEADDADDVRAHLIDLISRARAVDTSSRDTGEDKVQALRSELARCKVSVLKKRAASAGVPAQALLDADDCDDVKGRVVELLVAHTQARTAA
jgi:hypothetical protein